MDVVVGEDLADALDAGLDRRLVIGCGVLAEEVLQDERGHDRVALDGLDQVLAHDRAAEDVVDLLVEGRLHRRTRRSWRLGDTLWKVVVDHGEVGLFGHRSHLLEVEVRRERTLDACSCAFENGFHWFVFGMGSSSRSSTGRLLNSSASWREVERSPTGSARAGRRRRWSKVRIGLVGDQRLADVQAERGPGAAGSCRVTASRWSSLTAS